MRTWLPTFLAWMLVLSACNSDTGPASGEERDGKDNDAERGQDARYQPPPALPEGRPGLCARAGDDPVRDVFCGDDPPVIRSLRDLQEALGVAPLPPDADPEAQAAYVEGASTVNLARSFGGVAVLGHSTALSGRLVSPLNPRAIVLTPSTVLTFQRGVQRIELVTRDRPTARFNFYLLDFHQACTQSKHGCQPGDLYTPRIESDWTATALRDDEDLKNTAQDCRQCHQRGLERPALLMRELNSPWTHFFFPLDAKNPVPSVSGSDLLQDYIDAKGDERYGGYALQTISAVTPFVLESFVGPNQPLLFDAPKIESERFPYTAEGGYAREAQPSPTWERGYEAFKRGEQLSLPYFDQRATDLDKQAALAEAYQRFQNGELSEDELPDLGDIYPDDPMLRARMGLTTEPGATAEEALIQACGTCHNDVLDQTISRARFNVSVSRLDRAELDRAIDRINLPRDAIGAMPPPEFRQLDDDARKRLVRYLKRDPGDLDPSGMLESAAKLGMSGGAATRDRTTGTYVVPPN
jgi:hypothetical protein